MNRLSPHLQQHVGAIRDSGKSIYDSIDRDDRLWLSNEELEELLQATLAGSQFAGLALRTRSKVIKEHVCRALGFPVPRTFRKTQPRFIALDFDVYAQKANNLQIWNEEIAPDRRYVVIRLDEDFTVTRVRVLSGEELGVLDTTGTLTQKYQARAEPGETPCELITPVDTTEVVAVLAEGADVSGSVLPTDPPTVATLLPVGTVFRRLSTLVGKTFRDQGRDQERNRGADLHALASDALGYSNHADTGQFPDIVNQLLEVKLQTSPTVDLGLVLPDSCETLAMPPIDGVRLRHCDVRYAVFLGRLSGDDIEVTHLIVTTGEKFFSRFTQFQGKVLNKKLQLPLPKDFFD